MKLRDELAKLKDTINEYATEFDTIHAKLSQRGEPRPMQILFPLVYKRLVDHVERQQADHALFTFLGQYLATQHPGMSMYFISSRQRATLEELKGLLTKEMEGVHDQK